ncbi:MAG: DedA family protein, partial [Candidatus Taylorbacteria bacterium]
MDYIHWFQENFIHLDKSLEHIVSAYGIWVYAILFAIIFSETGLVIAPFLPGDALLFAVGAYCVSHPDAGLKWPVAMGLLFVAAILGNLVNFAIGGTLGGKIFKENALILKKEYLDRTHAFYEKYGGKTIIIARFVPIVRTFAPFVAGIGAMNYAKFIVYNIVGGVAWVAIFVFGGYWFGNQDFVKRNFSLVVLAIIIISVMPMVVEYLRMRYNRA